MVGRFLAILSIDATQEQLTKDKFCTSTIRQRTAVRSERRSSPTSEASIESETPIAGGEGAKDYKRNRQDRDGSEEEILEIPKPAKRIQLVDLTGDD